MSNAIRHGIEAPMGNSLSPEPCALIPVGHPCLSGHYERVVCWFCARNRPHRSHPPLMDGGYAAKSGGGC